MQCAVLISDLSLKTLLDTANGMEGKLHLSGILGVAADGEALSAQAALSSLVQPQSISITNPAGVVVEESTAIPAVLPPSAKHIETFLLSVLIFFTNYTEVFIFL